MSGFGKHESRADYAAPRPQGNCAAPQPQASYAASQTQANYAVPRPKPGDPLTADQLVPGKTYVETTTLAHDMVSLLVKVVVIALLFVLLFTFVFGIDRQPNGSMSPAINDGDALLVYHLDKEYVAGEVLVVDAGGIKQALRVVAVAGDVVDITKEGLLVNGNMQIEPDSESTTVPYLEGVTFPLTVEEGQVFVLGDAREHSTDSRIFGCVEVDQTDGTVISLLRRRNL